MAVLHTIMTMVIIIGLRLEVILVDLFIFIVWFVVFLVTLVTH